MKLYATLQQHPVTQVTYYHPGLGTMEPAGVLTPWRRKTTKLLGMAIGYGLANDVRDAYVFLMNHFQAGDNVFMFGFSRGAYTVRAVASLLHMYGLLRPGNEALVPYAIRMMTGIERARGQNAADRKKIDEYFNLAADSGLSIRTLRSFLDREPPGQALPCYRLAGKILVRRSDFDRYMEQYKTQGRPALLRALHRHGLPV